MGTLVLFLVLEEMLCFSPLRIACCWFAVYSLFYVEVCFFSLEKGMTPHSCLENPMDRGAWLATVQELQRVGHDWVCMQVPSVPNFRRVFFFFFIIHRCWIFSKAFYASIEMIIDHMVSSFNLLIWCATLVDLHKLKNPWVPRIHGWSWYVIFLMCCWIFSARICWGFLDPQ